MSKCDYIGMRIGMLTVVEETEQRKNSYVVWRCRCDCGGERLLDTRYLQRGTIRDCGCVSKLRPGQKDITGQRFGKLTALYPVEGGGYGVTLWHCQCDCGGEIDVPLRVLNAGYRKSCGCLSHPPLKDLTGRRFGRLTVLEYAGKQNKEHKWRCRCDCGKETLVRQDFLIKGRTQSCGCAGIDTRRESMGFIDGTCVAILEKRHKRLISTNKSGYNGVYQNKRTGKWAAQITFKGKTYFLGSYTKKEDAVKARQRGEEMYEDFLDWYYSCVEPDRPKPSDPTQPLTDRA